MRWWQKTPNSKRAAAPLKSIKVVFVFFNLAKGLRPHCAGTIHKSTEGIRLESDTVPLTVCPQRKQRTGSGTLVFTYAHAWLNIGAPALKCCHLTTCEINNLRSRIVLFSILWQFTKGRIFTPLRQVGKTLSLFTCWKKKNSVTIYMLDPPDCLLSPPTTSLLKNVFPLCMHNHASGCHLCRYVTLLLPHRHAVQELKPEWLHSCWR